MRAKSVGAEDLSIYLGRGVVVLSISFEGGMARLYEKWETSSKDKYKLIRRVNNIQRCLKIKNACHVYLHHIDCAGHDIFNNVHQLGLPLIGYNDVFATAAIKE